MSNIVTWIIFGLVVGIITHLIDPLDSNGSIVGTTLIGVLGSVFGGLIANLVLSSSLSGFNLTAFVVAITGSLSLLLVQRAVRRI